MKYDMTDKLIKIRENNRKKRHWHTILMFFSIVVVFCVTYALILPAITMERAATVAESSIPNSATTTKFNEIDGSGSLYYVLYIKSGSSYYALDGNGSAVRVTVSNGTVSWTNATDNMFWTFTSSGSGKYQIQNTGTQKYLYPGSSSVLATNASNTTVNGTSSTATFYGSRYATYSNSRFSVSRNSGTSFYIAAAGNPSYNVWYDGSSGGIMSLYDGGSAVERVEADQQITLPVSWKSPSKYTYTLRGWYDIKSSTYYAPGETVTVTSDMVLYADWEAATYNVGQNNEHVVNSLDTSDFITTHMFDYSSIFNMQSETYTGSTSSSSHSETWSLVTSGTVPYKNQETLNFIFRDWDSNGSDISYPAGASTSTENENKSTVTRGILDTRPMLIDTLFSTENAYNAQTKTGVLGKSYVGEANYLYQYDNDPDSEFYGYYYYDSKLNAASYNQSEERFYIYDYLERTSDSKKDGGAGAYSDFLPYNSPYIHTNDTENSVQVVKQYDDSGNITSSGTNYQYDAKYNNQESSQECAGTNYWFGMSSSIDFFLPNDCGTGGNIATSGNQMVFSFSGDDDVWVFVDGVLVLDIGGVHGIESGRINFSTGEVVVDDVESFTLMDKAASTNTDIASAGEHNLTLYYLERGGSQSNCAIYFNIAPRYLMSLEKRDAATTALLDGAEFAVYTNAECTMPAELWTSEEAYRLGEESVNSFTVVDGKGSIWGFCGGNTYYIKESVPPDGYSIQNGIIRMTLDNHGTASYDVDVIKDSDSLSKGFRVLGFQIDEVTHQMYLVVSNLTEDAVDVAIQKEWDVKDDIDIPDSVEVYLTADGVKVGENVTLRDENDWSHSWNGLKKYDDQDREIVYSIEEVPVSGFQGVLSSGDEVVSYTQWLSVETLVEGEWHLLTSNQGALAVQNGNLVWMDKDAAKESVSAQWTTEVNGLGFRLKNSNGDILAFNTTSKMFYVTDGTDGLQEIYYSENNLRAYLDEEAYYLNVDAAGNIGQASTDSGLEFALNEKVVVNGIQFTLTNSPIGQQTSLTVTKNWSDGQEKHSEHSVVIHLKADGVETGLELVLNAENNWTGVFEGLPYYQDDGTTKIRYSVEEEEVRGYTVTYSEVTENEQTMTYQVTITNNLIVYELPRTGGQGNFATYILGTIFMVLATIVSYKKFYKRGEI